MLEVHVPFYDAIDGKRFATVKECEDYERDNIHLLLANLSPERVKAALDRTDTALADIFENVGLNIRDLRRKQGNMRRAPPKAKTDAERTIGVGNLSIRDAPE